MPIQQILNNINPKKLFLIDGLGALLSAFMLGIILVKFENIFGMPRRALYILSFIACIFSVYSFSCFIRQLENWKPYLKIIAVANLIYCCVTLGLVINLYQKLTIFGLLYFVLEIIVIVILATTELKIA